jgi:isopenicillin N synthase-like dioxygenase
MREIHEKIAMNILKCLSVAVGLPEDYLGNLHKYDDPSFTTLRLMHYPAAPDGSVDYASRLPAHTDHDVITLLFQHQIMGLQVRPPHYSGPIADDEVWLDAPIIPGSVLINIGETLSFLSGGVMKSTWHRVVKSPREEDARKERFSIAYFCHATESTKLKFIEGIEGAVKREAPISCVTGEQVATVRDWIQHRHSYRGYVLEKKAQKMNAAGA